MEDAITGNNLRIKDQTLHISTATEEQDNNRTIPPEWNVSDVRHTYIHIHIRVHTYACMHTPTPSGICPTCADLVKLFTFLLSYPLAFLTNHRVHPHACTYTCTQVRDLVKLLLIPSPGRIYGTHSTQPVLVRAGPGTGKTWMAKQAACIYIYTYIYIHIHTHIQVRPGWLSRRRAYTYTHTYTYTYIHIYR